MKVIGMLAATLLCHAALAEDLLIRGAEVHTVSSKGKLANTDVLVRDGKITAVGAGLTAPSGALVVEARGRPLTPGLFGGLSGIGLDEVSAEPTTTDENLDFGAPPGEMQWRPEFDVTLAFNPRSTVLPIARVEGLTWTVLIPGGGSFMTGQGAAMSLDGQSDTPLGASRSLFVNMGSDFVTLSGGSRAAQYMLLDQAIREARVRGPIGENSLLHPAGREVLARYLAGGRVVFHVQRAADIPRVIDFARLHGMKPVISGGAEGWMVADDLARAGVPVLLDALENLPYSFDQLGARLDNAQLLHRAGVKIAFSQASNESHTVGKIRQLAGNAVAHGLPWDAALAALTANPAEIFGLGSSRGHIAPGQVADLVLWSGDPLEVTTLAEQVWIAGHAAELRSRQTELRDRYLERRKARAGN